MSVDDDQNAPAPAPDMSEAAPTPLPESADSAKPPLLPQDFGMVELSDISDPPFEPSDE